MNAGSSYWTWQKLCNCAFSSEPVLFFPYRFYYDLFHYSLPTLIETKTLLSAVTIILGNVSSSDEILPNPTSTNLRRQVCGRCHGCSQAHGRGRGQRCHETHRTMFPTNLRSSASSINRSSAQDSVPPLHAAPILQTPVILLQPALSAPSAGRSQTELAQGPSAKTEVPLLRVASVLLELDQLTSSLSNANQRPSEEGQELHSIRFNKTAHVANVDLKALEIRNLKAEKEGLRNLVADQDAGCKTSRKSQKCGDVFMELHLQYAEVASRGINSVPASYACETSEFCPFESVRKQRWSRRVENVSASGVVISSDAMIAPFTSDSIVRTDKYYRPSLMYESDFSKERVKQEMTDNKWS